MADDLNRFFFKLLLSGFSLIFTGMILLIIANLSSSTFTNFGGVIIIGPIPIIFGAGENGWAIALVASILTMICLLLFFLQKRRKRDGS
jgi:uncharacterized membrane protein